MDDSKKPGNPGVFPESAGQWGGMSLRDYFAAKAMNGICSSGPSHEWTNQRIAEEAYRMADAMLSAREVMK